MFTLIDLVFLSGPLARPQRMQDWANQFDTDPIKKHLKELGQLPKANTPRRQFAIIR